MQPGTWHVSPKQAFASRLISPLRSSVRAILRRRGRGTSSLRRWRLRLSMGQQRVAPLGEPDRRHRLLGRPSQWLQPTVRLSRADTKNPLAGPPGRCRRAEALGELVGPDVVSEPAIARLHAYPRLPTLTRRRAHREWWPPIYSIRVRLLAHTRETRKVVSAVHVGQRPNPCGPRRL